MLTAAAERSLSGGAWCMLLLIARPHMPSVVLIPGRILLQPPRKRTIHFKVALPLGLRLRLRFCAKKNAPFC